MCETIKLEDINWCINFKVPPKGFVCSCIYSHILPHKGDIIVIGVGYYEVYERKLDYKNKEAYIVLSLCEE